MTTQERIYTSRDFLVGATRLTRFWHGKRWAFHLINNSPDAIESAILKEVGYEWGDMGSARNPNLQFGPLAPGTWVEIWRDDDSAAELRMWLTLLIRAARGTQNVRVEFPKLYLVERLSVIPVVGENGVLGTSVLT